MKRLLRRWGKQFLPLGVRAYLKHRLEAGPDSSLSTNSKLTEEDGRLRFTIDDSWSFLAPLDLRDYLVPFINIPVHRTELYAIAQLSRRGGVLFDIGAHVGIFSAIFCAAQPRNRVFSFEPSPVSRPRLEAIRALNQWEDRMSIEQVGIGAAPGQLEMLIDPIGGYVQTQRFEHTMWSEPQKIQVPVETIAGAAARLQVIPDFIKIDIEGFEYEAIEGSLDFLTIHHPTLFFELHLNFLEQRKLSPKTFVEMLGSCGYVFHSHAGALLSPKQLYDSTRAVINFIATHPASAAAVNA